MNRSIPEQIEQIQEMAAQYRDAVDQVILKVAMAHPIPVCDLVQADLEEGLRGTELDRDLDSHLMNLDSLWVRFCSLHDIEPKTPAGTILATVIFDGAPYAPALASIMAQRGRKPVSIFTLLRRRKTR